MRHNHLVFALIVAAALGSIASPTSAEELSAKNFTRIHLLIRPGKGESKWLEVPWLTDVWQARQKAAAEGKPLLFWSGGGAAPIGGC